MITIDNRYLEKNIIKDINKHQKTINKIHEMIHNKSGLGNDYMGWLNLPYDIEKDIDKIEKASKKMKNHEVFVVIGIGGSYLGAKAGIDFLSKSFEKKNPEILFAGHNMSSMYVSKLLEYLKDKDFAVNVISKSGTTTEPALAFRLILNLMQKKYSKKQIKDRVIVTTDKSRGARYEMALKWDFERFEIPDDVGGRYSVLSAVGLLPLSVSGFNVRKILSGAKRAYKDLSNPELSNNSCYKYALYRNLLYKMGKKIEILASYENNMRFFNEWWKQLFGESEGKMNKGLFISSVIFSTDLHSLGQYIQEGERNLFETVIQLKNHNEEIIINEDKDNFDKLNYLKGKTLSYINDMALEGTIKAHVEGNVPNIKLILDNVSEESFGYTVYFFQKACAMSAYLLEVNPFDQPGVEKYKKEMFSLLGKKGY